MKSRMEGVLGIPFSSVSVIALRRQKEEDLGYIVSSRLI
jgi:hypothetical protein